MTDQTDSQLLKAYVERRLETAFTELARRHVDFVYSAAIRMVRDPYLAEDVTQSVFVALARQAPELAERVTLAGWLHRTAQNIAAQTVRTIERRHAREQEAVAMNELISSAPEASWEQIEPHLDAALGDLADPDRDAVLLRYYEKKTAAEMADLLGITDEAAQKRVSRAVERLREFFAKRGITVGAGGLFVVISTNAVQAAPVGLAVSISAAALAGTAASTSTIIATTTKAIAMTALQKTIIAAAIAVLAGVGIYEARQASQLRDQVQTFQQQQALLTEQIQQLQRERDEAAGRMTTLADELADASENKSELLKLRGEVAGLRTQLAMTRNARNVPEQEILKSAEEYLNRSERHLDNHNYEAQLDDLNKAIELNPQLSLAYIRRAFLFAENLPRERGGYVQALADYTQALEIEPDNVEAHQGRARPYEQMGKYSEAVSDLTFCIERFSQLSDQELLAGACINRAGIYRDHFKDFSKAIADYTVALQVRPYDQIVRRLRGQCYGLIGEREKAEQDFALLPKRQ